MKDTFSHGIHARLTGRKISNPFPHVGTIPRFSVLSQSDGQNEVDIVWQHISSGGSPLPRRSQVRRPSTVEGTRMSGAKILCFAWCCLMLFRAESTLEAAHHSLRGNSEQEQKVAPIAPSVSRNLIIGGNIAKTGDYPYFAHLEGISCGGSLIAPDVVLTAGHVSFCNETFFKHRSSLHPIKLLIASEVSIVVTEGIWAGRHWTV
jgi:hypothetical protein